MASGTLAASMAGSSTPIAVGVDTAEARELAHVERRLIAEFSPSVPTEQVRRLLEEAVGRFAAARVRRYVPLLVEKAARQQLRAAYRARPH
jgi:hypothetical protein